jgi:hypothetical protein
MGVRSAPATTTKNINANERVTLMSLDSNPSGDPSASSGHDETSTIDIEVVASGSDGTVLGAPRRWLRLEGATLVVGAIIAFSTTHQAWWLVPLTVLVPDVLAAGYLGGTRIGARVYNLAHSTPLPALMVGLGWWRAAPIVLALGLVWLAHIGVDRLLGYGLKYNDRFQHTHLGWIGGAGGSVGEKPLHAPTK